MSIRVIIGFQTLVFLKQQTHKFSRGSNNFLHCNVYVVSYIFWLIYSNICHLFLFAFGFTISVLEALYWIKQWVIQSLKAWQFLLLLLMVSWMMPRDKLCGLNFRQCACIFASSNGWLLYKKNIFFKILFFPLNPFHTGCQVGGK